MARASLVQEILFEVKNETALLGQVTSLLSVHGVSILHLCAYSVGGKGILQTIVDKPEDAKKALTPLISNLTQKEVVLVEFENKTGTLAPVAKILGNHGIFIDSVYGTSSDGFKIIGIFDTRDNARAVQAINQESGSLGKSC
ncbi:MAG: hypothetical protein FGM27_07750 [Candidatus Omnitrophica bacterium]|nr:hypothetical protein [Candidatus Omnitrophota bacterium]